VEPDRIYHELRQFARGLQETTTIEKVTYILHSRILPYILICVGMILLDNLWQYFMFIDMIDLSRTCESTIALICNSLVNVHELFLD
jgi:hypothetical protein